jgi:hypothetical protein
MSERSEGVSSANAAAAVAVALDTTLLCCAYVPSDKTTGAPPPPLDEVAAAALESDSSLPSPSPPAVVAAPIEGKGSSPTLVRRGRKATQNESEWLIAKARQEMIDRSERDRTYLASQGMPTKSD